MVRWAWTQLTSMRTALALLLLVALAAIPGSLIPQRAASTLRVRDFREANPTLDIFFSPLGLYDVYRSVWFSAIYLLLFVSLIGCILPRIAVYARAIRTPPPRVPRRLDRLGEYASGRLGSNPDAALDAAETWLRSKRFRVVRSEAGISAERGYLREFGNLLFHLALIFVLVGVAVSQLLGFKGTSVIVEGQGFSNNITQYDDFKAGNLVNTDALEPFTVKLKEFVVRFETGEVQRGAAREFTARVDLTVDGATTAETIQVNHPLTIDGTRVHLLGHGYAAAVTVTDGNGDVAYTGPAITVPQDKFFTSLGVIKVPDARPDRLVFQGWFLPTAVIDETGPHSAFPDTYNPQLFLTAWYGEPVASTGVPENLYTFNPEGLTQLTNGDQPVRFALEPGESIDLPDGRGSLTFDGYSRWTKLQISRTPGLPLTMGGVAVAVFGLCLSLFVRPRRLWIRPITHPDGSLGLEAAGLDRADARTGLSDDVTDLLAAAGVAPDEPDLTSKETS
ncbi:MAG TPA: cytochrome c biogenesis protein ResB [Propionibacteriaceae bacterium]|nr:cytochrome c biogenesis protein ResB [Propionibacteriaceae bacterium]